ncbi:MAG TPA: hypothetical protein VJ898_12610 [Natrialbaceae archaeon]|nr:hypothetical protein [Natrialbaceae archaeon]
MAQLTRRQALQVAGATLSGGLAGCTSFGQEGSDEPDSPNDPTATDPSPTIPSLVQELPAVVISNDTDQSRTLTLRVVSNEGPATTTEDSWDVSPNSNRAVESYPPLEREATVTALVEGYDSVSYDWNGGGGGALHVSIETDELSIEPIIT